MTYARHPMVKRGRMSAAEKAEIERLATTLAKPTPGRIASRLNRHPATVAWFMIRQGLIQRTIKYGNRPVGRRPNGTKIHPYTPEQDRRLVELRAAAMLSREIPATITPQFAIPPNLHSLHSRT